MKRELEKEIFEIAQRTEIRTRDFIQASRLLSAKFFGIEKSINYIINSYPELADPKEVPKEKDMIAKCRVHIAIIKGITQVP
jgi:hypothetical protein